MPSDGLTTAHVQHPSVFRRRVSRIVLRIAMALLWFVGLCSARVYMVLWIRLWRFFGLRLNGRPRFVSPNAYLDDLDKITLGDRVVISSGVVLLTHDYSRTTELVAAGEHEGPDVATIRPITIGDNVFLGWGSIVMPGTTIGDNVIVGAGSVVRGRIASGSVVVGNPAQVVCTMDELHKKHSDRIGTMEIRQDG